MRHRNEYLFLEPFPVLVSVGSERLKETAKSNLTSYLFFLCKLSMGKSLNSFGVGNVWNRKTGFSGEKDPKTSSLCSCSCFQIGIRKVKMFPKNIHTFLDQNCSSNAWLRKLDIPFASLAVFQEVEGSIVSIYQSCKIIEFNVLLGNGTKLHCSVQSALHAVVCKRSVRAAKLTGIVPLYILFLCLTCTQKRENNRQFHCNWNN